MKIKKIELQNHPILGNFIFDFSIDGSVRNFALLVGENGCGKTIFLEAIHKILERGFTLWGDGINRKVTIEFNHNEKEKLGLTTNIIIIDYDESKHLGNVWERFSFFDKDGNGISNPTREQFYPGSSNSFNNVFKCAFSTVEINFSGREVEAIKATTIDSYEATRSKSTPEIATEIAQLLVDINNQDNAEKGKHFDNGKSNKDVEYKSKFDRFKEAYAKMFEGKELQDVRINNGKYQVLFKDIKQNKEFDISALSSGEKQIVYRVGYLLRNLRGINGGVVLIDEPELSLHPLWQEKYLKFLREVFFTGTEVSIQFIIATHSPLLLKGALDKDVSVHILKKDGLGGAITVTNAQEKGFGLLKWSPSWGEICYFAYGLPSVEFHDDLYSTIEDSLKTNPGDKVSQADFEKHIRTKIPDIINKNKNKVKWSNGSNNLIEETIMTFVRNSIHHPDNKYRPEASPEQIKDSIDIMLGLIKNP